MVEFVALLWPIFLQPVYKLFVVLTCWTVCWFMLICVFRYIDMDGCKLYVVDIIIHDIEYKIWYVNVSHSIHYSCNMI